MIHDMITTVILAHKALNREVTGIFIPLWMMSMLYSEMQLQQSFTGKQELESSLPFSGSIGRLSGIPIFQTLVEFSVISAEMPRKTVEYTAPTSI